MKTTSRDMYAVPGTDIEVELPIKPSFVMDHKDANISIDLVSGEITIGYLADDSDAENPLENDDYAGKILEARRHGPTLKDYERALGLGDWDGEPRDPYAVLLDVYEHGGVSYSLHGTGTQCQFDTARGGACYVPSDMHREDLDKLPRDEALAKVRELAAADAKTYTDWCNGNCFVTVVATYDREGALLDWDSCGGYIGDDDAYAALKEEFPS
jgi:hypothetical protein